MKLKAETKLQTRLNLTPRLDLALKLLKMTSLELEERIEAEMLANPVLEVTPQAEEAPEDRQAALKEEAAITEYLLTNELPESSFHLYEPETPERQEVASEPSLIESLAFQVHTLKLSEEQRLLALLLVGNLDNRGYLDIPLEEAASAVNVSMETAERTLAELQKLEPAGIFARNLRESLHLQLKDMGLEGSLADRLLLEPLEDIKKPNTKDIAHKLGVDEEEARRAIELIGRLDPAPALRVVQFKSEPITPDVTITKVGNDFVVIINRPYSPRLRLSHSYLRLLEQPWDLDPGAREYLRKRVSAAKWFVRSVQQRETTLYKVCTTLVNFQRGFLEAGIEQLKPLALKDVAKELGIHESTVSRAIAGKYAQSPQGIIALKDFFAHALPLAQGLSVASKTLKAWIQEMLSQESPGRPLSDIEITKRLVQAKGVSVARRTVAKYRKEMGLGTSSSRKG